MLFLEKGFLLFKKGGRLDSAPARCPYYEEKLTRIISALRERTGLHRVPFLVGGLGDYLVDYHPELGYFGENYKKANNALQNIAKKQPNVGFVPHKKTTPVGVVFAFLFSPRSEQLPHQRCR